MSLFTRLLPAALATGMVASGLLISPGAARSGTDDRSAAAPPICHTRIGGVLPNGKLLFRDVTNVRITREKSTAAAQPRIDALLGGFREAIEGGERSGYAVLARGKRPRLIYVTDRESAAHLTVAGRPIRYSRGVGVRVPADSGSYFLYGLDEHDDLVQWTRYQGDDGTLFHGSPKVIARNQGSIKTLTWVGRTKGSGKWADNLVATTRGGALKSLHVPWTRPGKATIRTVRASGFGSYTGASHSYCGGRSQLISMIFIDRHGNKAQWYTFNNGDWNLTSADLIRRRAVAPGANWRLHAVN